MHELVCQLHIRPAPLKEKKKRNVPQFFTTRSPCSFVHSSTQNRSFLQASCSSSQVGGSALSHSQWASRFVDNSRVRFAAFQHKERHSVDSFYMMGSRPSFLPCLLVTRDLWMWGMTPPPAMVALIRVSNCRKGWRERGGGWLIKDRCR